MVQISGEAVLRARQLCRVAVLNNKGNPVRRRALLRAYAVISQVADLQGAGKSPNEALQAEYASCLAHLQPPAPIEQRARRRVSSGRQIAVARPMLRLVRS